MQAHQGLSGISNIRRVLDHLIEAVVRLAHRQTATTHGARDTQREVA
tara:strand:- start:211 stop:351 length:141 start_codon:yes stop_codon:yes gene_type:complete